MTDDATPDPALEAAGRELDALVRKLNDAGIDAADLGVLLIGTGTGIFLGSLCARHRIAEFNALKDWIDKRIAEARAEMN